MACLDDTSIFEYGSGEGTLNTHSRFFSDADHDNPMARLGNPVIVEFIKVRNNAVTGIKEIIKYLVESPAVI